MRCARFHSVESPLRGRREELLRVTTRERLWMAEKKVSAGEVIFSEGDVADVAYTVISGSVETFYLNSNIEVKLGLIEAGKVFGELAVFMPDELRQYGARAVSDAVLDAITPEEFEKQFYASPKPIQPFLLVAIEKTLPTRNRVKNLQPTLSKGDIDKITITPASDVLKAQMKPVEIPVSSLPFRVGGYPEDGKKNPRDQLHLAIASLKNPLLVSRQHCEITLDNEGNIIVNDLGSRFCTTVNGIIIGRGRGIYSAPLKKGSNEIYLGNEESKYKLAIACK